MFPSDTDSSDFSDPSSSPFVVDLFQPGSASFDVVNNDSLMEFIANNSISAEVFFQSLLIEENFLLCVVVEIVDDRVIEDREEFTVTYFADNANDVFAVSNSTSAVATVEIADNDGMCREVYNYNAIMCSV